MITALLMGAAFAVSALTVLLLMRYASRLGLQDHPNDRSLHRRVTPRGGGLGIVIATYVIGAAIVWNHGSDGIVFPIAAAGLAVAAVSLWDDVVSLPVSLRMLVQVFAVVGLVHAGLLLPATLLPGVTQDWPGWVVGLATTAYLVWMVNLYNFMDGMDGFAGGMTLFGFGGMAWLGLSASDLLFAGLCGTIAMAAIAFLLFNFPPARIFMGDVGASFLGLLAGALGLWGVQRGLFPFWVSVLLFSPFFTDATFTLLRRMSRGERVWRAHRTHLYQRMVQSGWGHRKTVLVEYALMTATTLTAVHLAGASVARQQMAVLLWALIYAALIVAATTHESRRRVQGRSGTGSP
jgi:UDP-N-acetylmuramyl pentapeptide phosphotransferase/UDP-N-acetylglucosamine-1-phosphate transferase